MEVLASVISSLLGETCRNLCSSISSRISNFYGYESYFRDLDKEMKELKEQKDSVNQNLKAAQRLGQVARAEVKDWQRQVSNIEAEVNTMKEEMQRINSKCFHGCCFKCFNLERSVAAVLEKINSVKLLVEAGRFPSGVATASQFPVTVEHIPAPSIEDQSTAGKNTEKVMDLLSKDEVKRIGIWGMGGVGKTTLVKNVNNKLMNASSFSGPFSIIIWITVSNKSEESDLGRVQKQIADRLMMGIKEENRERMACKLYERLEKEKFLLILDDVWEPIDLDIVGIPRPEIHKGCKIMLTTRFSEVCAGMMTDVVLKVEILNDEEAWRLFYRSAGEVATLKHIEPLARAVTRECCGLPLAIIVVGASLRGKKIVELWADALNTLRHSRPIIKGIEDKVFNPLKWSYDALPDKHIKSCFLYCCLYPEDHRMFVDDLAWYWFAEGLLDEEENLQEVRNRGIAITECLKDASLLEEDREGAVRMHDVVRDVSVWIASSSEEECKSIVKSGLGLNTIRKKTILASARRLSFMFNELSCLPESVSSCPLASSLLLQDNPTLGEIPDLFLRAFPSLRVLDLSGCSIKSLPLSLDQLVELRALFLARCGNLEGIPPVGGLGKLQLLDCSRTNIKALPQGMERLTSLRKLDLSRIKSSTVIPAGALASLANLEILDMSRSSGEWHMKEKAGEGPTPLEEILLLERLTAWYVNSDSIPCTVTPSDVLIHRIKKIEKLKVSVGTCSRSIRMLDVNSERPVILNDLMFSGDWIGWLFVAATSVHLYGCEGLNQMLEKLAINSAVTGSFDCLSILDIASSQSSFQLRANAQLDLLPNLEILQLRDLTRLTSISWLSGNLGLKFPNLRCIRVERCPRMKYLLSLGTSILPLEKLEEITVDSCEDLEELFRYDSTSSSQILAPDAVVPNIKMTRLKALPKLQDYCRQSATWPRIDKLEVIMCPSLRRLPVTTKHASSSEIEVHP